MLSQQILREGKNKKQKKYEVRPSPPRERERKRKRKRKKKREVKRERESGGKHGVVLAAAGDRSIDHKPEAAREIGEHGRAKRRNPGIYTVDDGRKEEEALPGSIIGSSI